MNNIEILKITENDIPEIVDIWYETSLQAHSFIPCNYWKANRVLMKNKYIPMSETYSAADGEKILGFISLIDEYLAAVFIRPEFQSKGIGSALLNHAKTLRNALQLKVFSKNKKSIEFYKKEGFTVISELKDEETKENEFVMQWYR